MMRPKTITATVTGASQAIPLDRYVNGYALAVKITPTNATATYTVQHTFDDPGVVNLNTGGTWYNHDDAALVSAATNKDSNYAFVPTATRIYLHEVSASPTVSYTIVPMGAM